MISKGRKKTEINVGEVNINISGKYNHCHQDIKTRIAHSQRKLLIDTGEAAAVWQN